MYLDNLYKKLNITNSFDKSVLAAMVFDTLLVNPCGVNHKNEKEVKNILIEGIPEYQFEIFRLACYWGNDLSYLLLNHLGLNDSCESIYEGYIWPYLRENKIMDGVDFK